MRRHFSIASVLLTLVFSASSARCYNEAGHMVSGSVAYKVLSGENSDALMKVVCLLKKHPQFDGWKRKLDELPPEDRDHFLLMLAARWPDDIRSNKKYTHPEWHYVDFPWRPEGEPESLPLDEPKGENALTALQANLEILGKDVPDADKAIAVCWILHLVGDIHQPLHTISVVTRALPEGDAGGTRVSIIPPGFEKPLALHFFWDNLILNNDCFCMSRDRASKLLEQPEFAKEKLTELTEGDFRNWAKKESHELAKKYAYREGRLALAAEHSKAPPLPDDYAASAKPIAERQIVLSGYRIAELINRAFGEDNSR